MRRLLVCLPLCLAAAPSPLPPDFKPAPLARIDPSDAPLPDQARMEILARTDPVALLEACARRYEREVQGYTCRLHKRERIRGHLQGAEEIDVAFREKPFSALLRWKSGARLAGTALFVRDENDNQVLIRPAGLLSLAGIQTRDPHGEDARGSARYPLSEFGLQVGTRRTLAAWSAARDNNALYVEYLGVERPADLGGRSCWAFKRSRYASPESDGVTGQVVHVDRETWLQIGNVVTGEKGALIGEYYFRDVNLNPTIPDETFTIDALKR